MRSGCDEHRPRSTDRRDSLSSVSSRRSTDSGRPARFGRILFLELGTSVCGSRALDGTGDEFIGSSSGMGEGEAFLLREEAVVDTITSRAVSDTMFGSGACRGARDLLDREGERRVCSWK